MFIYIHLPFCLSHCIYCDFYVELDASDDRRKAYLGALKREINYYLSGQNNSAIETVYFGGGTPGLFTAAEIEDVLHTIGCYAQWSDDAEITLEANPERLASPIEAYWQAGVNRLSIGVQSLQPNELKRLSRIHSATQARRFISEAQAAGFQNVSIDLMYGIPEQTLVSWQATLDEIASLNIQHISMYGLKVEPNTRLDKLVAQGRMQVPEDDLTVDMYDDAIDYLAAIGFEAYEISNLSRPGFASRHNLNYWDNNAFWGFGVSAHGYINHQRTENPRDLKTYLAHPTQHSVNHACSPEEQLENALIFGLRKTQGIHLTDLEMQYTFDFRARYAKALQKYFDAGRIVFENNYLKLTRKGIPVSNSILEVFLSSPG